MANAGQKSQPKYRFAEFLLDPERGAVLHAGREVKLRPKVYDALLYILENRGRLIGKEELNRALWPDSFVTEDSLVQCMVELRRALGDRAQEILKTVPRRGYVFAAAVTMENHGGSGKDGASALAPTAPTLHTQQEKLLVARRVPGRYYLPLPRTPLIGRERELPAVRHLVLALGRRPVTHRPRSDRLR
jgi:DNA-binding winged helix-turn-helix (wHTH) protein